MSEVRITIKTDNAAFCCLGEPDALTSGGEVARILRDLAEQFESNGECYPPRDFNNNIVGKVEIIEQSKTSKPNWELFAACRAAIPWLGVLITKGAHLQCAAPDVALQVLAQVEAAVAQAKETGR